MDEKFVMRLASDRYGIKFNSCKKIKSVYKLESENSEPYCLKVVKYTFSHFYFIISAIMHLKKNGFLKIPDIIYTNDNIPYIELQNNYCYLTKWVTSRESNYDNPIDLKRAAIKLAELHNCSEGFVVNEKMTPRVLWFTWENTFKVRGDEILDFERRAYQKAYRSDFDKLYISMIPEEIKRIEKTLDILKNSNYKKVMFDEVRHLGFCHHDYAHHNVLVDPQDCVNIIDFDYCILDTHLHDLGSLIIRASKDGKWDTNKCRFIMENYSSLKEIKKDEIDILRAFIKFPQQFWQVGLQYYWERQPYDEDNFLKRLLRYKNDIEDREEFLDEFIRMRW